MTISQYTRQCMQQLAPVYEESESRWLMRIILEHIKGWSQTDIMLNSDREADPELITAIDTITGRLLRQEPIQYILGTTYWHGLTLKVTPAVLIPREETSELVDIIERDYRDIPDLHALDICTGSGCIAIALARSLPFAAVTATDISAEALEVARDNAAACKTKVSFVIEDALQPTSLPDSTFDIIVSNPPYIAQSEDKLMEANVLDYEPHGALFVPDDNPLLFYRSISANALKAGRPGSRLYLEINPLYRSQLCAMLEADGWADVQSVKDIHGKDRFVTAIHPS